MHKLITITAFFLITGCAANQYVDSRNSSIECEDLIMSGCRESSHDVETLYHNYVSPYQLFFNTILPSQCNPTKNHQKYNTSENYIYYRITNFSEWIFRPWNPFFIHTYQT